MGLFQARPDRDSARQGPAPARSSAGGGGPAGERPRRPPDFRNGHLRGASAGCSPRKKKIKASALSTENSKKQWKEETKHEARRSPSNTPRQQQPGRSAPQERLLQARTHVVQVLPPPPRRQRHLQSRFPPLPLYLIGAPAAARPPAGQAQAPPGCPTQPRLAISAPAAIGPGPHGSAGPGVGPQPAGVIRGPWLLL